MDDILKFNYEFLKNRKLKSFIRIGATFVDLKETIGFSFIEDPDGYIIVQFVYDSGRAMNAFMANREEFSQFLLQLDPFLDDNVSMPSMEKFMDEIEVLCNKAPKIKRVSRKPRKTKEEDMN